MIQVPYCVRMPKDPTAYDLRGCQSLLAKSLEHGGWKTACWHWHSQGMEGLGFIEVYMGLLFARAPRSLTSGKSAKARLS